VADGRFPIVALEPGLGFAALQYSTLAENLASHGYTGNAARQGDRLVDVWAADARFAAMQVAGLGRVGRFAGRVDATRTSYVGHSFGGAASLEACRSDPRCAGAVELDGTQYGPVVRTGLNKPR
jgi:predicted dienelactone hydrolase